MGRWELQWDFVEKSARESEVSRRKKVEKKAGYCPEVETPQTCLARTQRNAKARCASVEWDKRAWRGVRETKSHLSLRLSAFMTTMRTRSIVEWVFNRFRLLSTSASRRTDVESARRETKPFVVRCTPPAIVPVYTRPARGRVPGYKYTAEIVCPPWPVGGDTWTLAVVMYPGA